VLRLPAPAADLLKEMRSRLMGLAEALQSSLAGLSLLLGAWPRVKEAAFFD
jgi:hypothetical protein